MSRKNADKNANTLCWISLICLIAPFILSTLMGKLVLATSGTIIGGLIVFINSLLDILLVVARIIGVVLCNNCIGGLDNFVNARSFCS